MNKRDRVMAVMNGERGDRTPVGFWFHFPPEKGSGEACVNAHLDYYNHVDVDMVKIMCDGYFDYPNPVAKAVEKASDWYKLKPLGPDSDFVRGQIERAKAVKRGLKDDCVVIYNVFAPFSSIRFGTSDELVMRCLREDPDAIRYALDVIAQDNAAICRGLVREAGIDGSYFCVQGGEEFRFTHEEYMSLIAPSELEVLDAANSVSDTNVLHCCGWAGDKNRLENWKNYPVKMVNWAVFIENMGLKAGKDFFGKPVLGGFDNRKTGLLYNGTKEEIQSFARALVAEAGAEGLMLGADCTLPGDIAMERIEWVLEAVR